MFDFSYFFIVSAFVFFIIFLLNKDTFLDFKNIWSIIFYKQAVFIILPVLLLSIYEVKDFHSLKMVKQSSVFFISNLIIFSFSIFTLSFLILNKFLLNTPKNSMSFSSFAYNPEIDYFSVAAVFSGVFLLIYAILFLGYEHAFITSITTSTNVLHVRLQNAYLTSLPSQVAYLISVSCWVASIYSGLLATKRRRFTSLVFFLIALFLSSAGGAKAPVVSSFIYFVMSYLYCSSLFNKKISFKKVLLWSPLYVFIVFMIIYYAVSLQITDLNINNFFIYLVERLGVGQMAGVFETFSINFSLPESAWHMVPFASLFIDYPIFSKELMLFTENREFTSTGVKNSLFIAEAYGMGGWSLMIMSPIWMAIAYIIKIFIISFFLKIAFGESVRAIYLLPLFFLSTDPTGDFSSFAFQKGTILLVIVLSVFYIVKVLIKPFSKIFIASKFVK